MGGFRIKEGQEERLQRFCSLLPEANPGVQGSFRYHGRRQRRSFVFLRHCAAFNSVGKSVSDGEAQGMLSEAPGPVNFTQMVMLFAEKMAGGADDDDTILKAFDAFEVNGKIDADMFKHSLMTFGDKFSASEVDNAFGEFVIEDGMIDAVQLKGLMVSKKDEEAE